MVFVKTPYILQQLNIRWRLINSTRHIVLQQKQLLMHHCFLVGFLDGVQLTEDRAAFHGSIAKGCEAHISKHGIFPCQWGIEDASFALKMLAVDRVMAKNDAALIFPF